MIMACNCQKRMDRRTFVKLGVGGLVVTGTAGIYATVRSLTPVVSYEAPRIMEIGRPLDFLGDTIHDFQVGDRKVSVMPGDNGLYALVRNCTHMGCIPNYSEIEGQFLCPCHGSVFTKTGDVVRGPAPEPLFRAALVVNARGAVEVNANILENDPAKRETSPFVLEV